MKKEMKNKIYLFICIFQIIAYPILVLVFYDFVDKYCPIYFSRLKTYVMFVAVPYLLMGGIVFIRKTRLNSITEKGLKRTLFLAPSLEFFCGNIIALIIFGAIFYRDMMSFGGLYSHIVWYYDSTTVNLLDIWFNTMAVTINGFVVIRLIVGYVRENRKQ